MGSLYTIRSGATAMPEDTFLQDLSDLLQSGGVKDLNTTDNHFKVTQAGTPNMSVDVNIGRAFVKQPSIQNAYPVRHTGSVTNLVIGANASGSPRKDAIILWIDTAASPTTTGDNVAKLKVVPGTPSGSPAAPTDSEIQTNVGAANPFIRLANVNVINAETQIDNADIEDARSPFGINGAIGGAIFGIVGTLVVANDVTPYYVAPKAGAFTSIHAVVKTAPVGANILIEINKNGVAQYTLTLDAGTTSKSVTGLNIAFAAGDYFSIDITQIGSTTPGADLTIAIG